MSETKINGTQPCSQAGATDAPTTIGTNGSQQYLEVNEQLRFTILPGEPSSASLQLTNRSQASAVAFKIKTTNPKRYLVRPNSGVCWSSERTSVLVQIPAMHGIPADAAKSRDKFQVLSLPLDAEIAARLRAASDEQRRVAIVDLWASDAHKAAAVDKVRATLVFDWAKADPIPEEGPLSPHAATDAESTSRTPFRTPARPPPTPHRVATTQQADVDEAHEQAEANDDDDGAGYGTARCDGPPLQPTQPDGANGCASTHAPAGTAPPAAVLPAATSGTSVTTGLAGASIACGAAYPSAFRMAEAEAEGGMRSHTGSSGSMHGSMHGSLEELRKLDDLRSQLDESEATRRAMRAQMERALAEYEREKLEHAEQLRTLQAQLAAERARNGAAATVEQPAPKQHSPAPSAQHQPAVSSVSTLLVAILALLVGLLLRPLAFPLAAPHAEHAANAVANAAASAADAIE